jgi:hypothetical protein
MLWCCRLSAACLVFQQFMTILELVIPLKLHTSSKTCEAVLLFIPQVQFYIRLLFKVIHFFILKACMCSARWHLSHTSYPNDSYTVQVTVSEKDCMPSHAEARLCLPPTALLCSLLAWYFAVSYHVL